MSIATEIQRLQEAKADIKTAIEEKGVEVGNGLIDGYADKVDDVYDKGVSDGKKSQYAEIWNTVSNNWTRTAWIYAFRNWNCEYLHPPKQIKPTESCNFMFSLNPSLKRIEKKYFDFSGMAIVGAQDMFQNCPSLEVIEDVGLPAMTSYNYTFSSSKALKTIECVRFSNITTSATNTFTACDALENITIEGEICITLNFQWSKLLAKSSIESIINHLSDTQGATLTLSKTAVNNAFGSDTSDEWIETIADKVSSYNGVTYDGLWKISLV